MHLEKHNLAWCRYHQFNKDYIESRLFLKQAFSISKSILLAVKNDKYEMCLQHEVSQKIEFILLLFFAYLVRELSAPARPVVVGLVHQDLNAGLGALEKCVSRKK